MLLGNYLNLTILWFFFFFWHFHTYIMCGRTLGLAELGHFRTEFGSIKKCFWPKDLNYLTEIEKLFSLVSTKNSCSGGKDDSMEHHLGSKTWQKTHQTLYLTLPIWKISDALRNAEHNHIITSVSFSAYSCITWGLLLQLRKVNQ